MPHRRVLTRLADLLRRLLPARFRERTPLVSVVRLAGTIGGVSPFRPTLSLAALAGTIEAAFEAPSAAAVALVINSPGGSAVQSHLLYQRIRALAEEKRLPVFAFAEDAAASGGYLIALAADEIFADPSSIVGSIGVVAAGFGFDRLIERFGIERRVHTAGTEKAMLDPFRPERPDDVERLKQLQAGIHAHFITLVKERRAGRLKGDDEALFSGAFWSAHEATALGLIDGLGDVRAVMRQRFGDKVRLRLVERPRGLALARLFGPRTQPGILSEAGSLMVLLEARALWNRYGL